MTLSDAQLDQYEFEASKNESYSGGQRIRLLIKYLRAARKELANKTDRLNILRSACNNILSPIKLGEHGDLWTYRKNKIKYALAKEKQKEDEFKMSILENK